MVELLVIQLMCQCIHCLVLVGSCIIFIAIYVICLILILDISLHDTFFYLKDRFMVRKITKEKDSKELYIENNDKQEELIVKMKIKINLLKILVIKLR